MKNCNECKYCILEDNGYSNYTVEGTDADCLISENEGFPIDAWYGRDSAMHYADQCNKFSNGEPVEVDVERDMGDLVNYSDDTEIKELLTKFEA